MRLIDADKLIDEYNKSDGTISDLMELILDAEEINFDHVIRCKDCKYHLPYILEVNGKECCIHYCNMNLNVVEENGFCNYAKEKETED